MRFATLCAVALSFSAVACESNNIEPNGDDPSAVAGSRPDTLTGGNSDTPSANAPMVSRDFTEVDELFANPERGYYVGYDLLRPERAAAVRESGHTLALAKVRLDAYRDAAIPDALLAQLDTGFNAARGAGIKVILRFTYNSSFADDAPKARMLQHISQVQPLLQRHADVIAIMQAGFIGAWGEWHSSTNGLDNPADRKEILDALLAALPASRTVGVRRPMFKDAAYPGGPMSADEAYDGSARARVAHHNDCFLASNSDYGTYASPIEFWTGYVGNDGRYTPAGGETCAVYAPKTDCSAAVANMENGHWSYLNRDYNRLVLDLWDSQGCGPEVERRLGYRFVLDRAAHTEAVAPGGELDVEIDLRNTGFTAPYNKRPVEIVLRNADSTHVVRLSGANSDARRWVAGETTTLAVRLRIPADIAAGTYSLALRLPDETEALSGDARYSIRTANEGTWNAQSGDNVLTNDLVIDASAPGARDSSATDFVQLR
jgi:hypothetical protein